VGEETCNYKWYECINGFLPVARKTMTEGCNSGSFDSDNNVDEAVVYKHNTNDNCLLFWSNGDDHKFFVEEMSSELILSNLDKRLYK
jgi:hypothetical protein